MNLSHINILTNGVYMDLGHWIFTEKSYIEDFNPADWFGFIYRVTNTVNGMEYIGKKQFENHTRKIVKGRKNRKRVSKESNWKEYLTSSSHVHEAIEHYGKENFKFEIIELCKTRGDLTYSEVEIQWQEKVLEATLPNGDFKFYNKAIGNVKFRHSKVKKQLNENN